MKSTYKRHGTLNPFAALTIATGQVQTRTTDLKRREEFLAFMDQIVAEAPPGRQLHVILDNYCTHKKCDDGLARHPQVHFHFTPTSARWLNQVEIWFSLLSRKALRGASFKTIARVASGHRGFYCRL
jgi:transposase